MPENTKDARSNVVAPVAAETTNVVKFTRTSLIADKTAGLTNADMAKKYSLPAAQISRALKMAGLDIKQRRAKGKLGFVIIPE